MTPYVLKIGAFVFSMKMGVTQSRNFVKNNLILEDAGAKHIFVCFVECDLVGPQLVLVHDELYLDTLPC